MLVYHRDRGMWPRQFADVEPLLYEPERFGSVAFSLREEGGVDVTFTGRPVVPSRNVADMMEDAGGSTLTVYATQWRDGD